MSTSDSSIPGAGRSQIEPHAANAWLAVWMLAWREWIRFFRQRSRVIGALGQPILFWILFGTGMHAAFRGGSQDFMSFFLPGTITLIMLFTAIFATISIIEDRREGFLQGVLVAPVPRWTIVAGKVVGGSAIAWAQALLFLILTLLIGALQPSWHLIPAILLMAIAAGGMTALGVCFAWPTDSTQAFHAIMNLVLIPGWLLSGAFFPVPLATPGGPIGQHIMHWVMRVNPLSYVVLGLRQTLQSIPIGPDTFVPSLATCWVVSVAFLAGTTIAAWRIVCRPNSGDLT